MGLNVASVKSYVSSALTTTLFGSGVGEREVGKLTSICSGQQKLATALEFFPYRFSDSFGGNPPLYSCGLSAL